MKTFDTTEVGGVPFQVASIQASVRWLADRIGDRTPVSIRLANAYCVALADADADYGHLLKRHGVNFPDGFPIVWAMKINGFRHAERVRGPSFFISAIADHAQTGTRPFFLGATEGTLNALESNLLQQFPDLRIAGSFSPPFAPVTSDFIDECAEEIRRADPDVVWIGLGTPKQDLVSHELAQRVSLPCIGVGAAFDFAAGTVKEAPLLVQNSGFEWLYRLTSEPRRLWHRYTVGNARFLWAATKGAMQR